MKPAQAPPGRLRVAVDATPLLGQVTGIGTFTLGLLEALAARSDVVSRAFSMTWRGRRQLDRLVPRGVAARHRPLPARLALAVWKRFDVPTVDWWTGEVDVVHATNFVCPPAGCQEVVTVHDLTAWHYSHLIESRARDFPRLLRRAVRRGAWIHTNSRFVADEVRDLPGVDPERVVPIHPGLPRVTLPPGLPGSGHGLLGLHDDEAYVLALGTVEPRKNYVRLVQAFDIVADKHPDLHLVIAGKDGWGAEGLASAIGRARYGRRVHRLGYVSDEVRASLLADASLLAYPSVYEGFGFPPLEAMGCGVPVVMTDAGSLPEVAGDAAVMVGALSGADPLAAEIERVVSDADLRRDLRARGLALVERYSWERTIEEMVRLYAACAG